jgi:uncharacterized protein YndB with AHSA1/START domain
MTIQEHKEKLMTEVPTVPPMHGKVVVGVPIEVAFRVFTESLHTWWPPMYHIGQADMAEAVLEGKVGGRWFERGVDGSECDWGRVLVWEPPARLIVTWQINGYWAYDPDPDHASEIEVRFTPDGAETVVELEHRFLDRLVSGQGIHDGITGGGGWTTMLEMFAGAARDGSAS